MKRTLRKDGFFITDLTTAVEMTEGYTFTSTYSTITELFQYLASINTTTMILWDNETIDEFVAHNHNIIAHITNMYMLVSKDIQEPMDLNSGIIILELHKARETKDIYKVNTKHKFAHELMVGLSVISKEQTHTSL